MLETFSKLYLYNNIIKLKLKYMHFNMLYVINYIYFTNILLFYFHYYK